MIYWPEAFCQGLADRGYHVIRFDNRDVGLSHKLEGEKPPGFFRIIEAPTLVIHGKEDPLVPLEAGVDTARHISGAKIELIDGMGHDMPGPLLPKLVELIASHADMATNES